MILINENEKFKERALEGMYNSMDACERVLVEMYNSLFHISIAKKMLNNYVTEAINMDIDLNKTITAYDHCILMIKTNAKNYLYGLIDENLYEKTNGKLGGKLVQLTPIATEIMVN